MKYLHIILFFFLVFSVKATENSPKQLSLQLQWKGIERFADEQRLVFDQAVYSGIGELPYYSRQISLLANQEIDSLRIENPVFANFSAEELLLIENHAAAIADTVVLNCTYLHNKKEKNALISFLPIVYQNGVYKKLVSFSLSFVVKSFPSLRSASTTGVHSFASNSVLQTGKWIKISVSQSGIHKISYNDLLSWGITNPQHVRIFGYGGAMLPEDFSKAKADDLPQIAVWKEKGADGVFNAGDFLLFYAQGPVSWTYNQSVSAFVRTMNPYSFSGYYFITSDVGVDKTIEPATALSGVSTVSVTDFLDYQLHENETRNILSSGREWYSEEFGPTAEYTFSYIFPNIVTDKNCKIRVDAAAKSSQSTSMSAFLNGLSLGSFTFPISGTYDGASKRVQDFSALPSSASLQVKLRYNNASTTKAWLNYISINAYRQLSMYGNSMFFRNPDIVQSNQLASFSVSGNEGLLVWDITDASNAKQLPTDYSAGQYTFLDSAEVLKEYVALYPSGSFLSPQLVGGVPNQNMHGLPQYDMVIITHPDFYSQAEQLAQKHRVKDGLSVVTLTPTEIYNEFSSGTPDATAFRWLMKMFYDRALSQADAPKYLLLFGDGTYDNRIIDSKNKDVSKLITYQASNSLNEILSYVSDDYFGLLDDNEGANIASEQIDIGIGRLPVSTQEQANDMLTKISNYIDDTQKGYWKNRLAYIADDDDDLLHTSQADQLVKSIESTYPSFQPKRYFLDAFIQEKSASGESYPLAKESLFNLINKGLLLVNYTGHGSIEGLANEKIISRNDVSGMYNKVLPLMVTATCSFSRFDNTGSSTGEDILLNNHGGVIGLFTTTRTVYAYSNFELNKEFNKYIFKIENGKPLSLGEIMRRTKNGRVGDVNRLNFTLLADPALVLPIPINQVVVTEIASNSNVVADTIQALSTVTVKGEILSSDSVLLSQFNGVLTASVFDKKMSVSTLGNESASIYTYSDRINTLFYGKTTVANGLFTLTFMVPKDIAYNIDFGRINFYAADETNDLEAQGSFEDFYIGGSKSDFQFENHGPVIDMYINDPGFKNGQIVDVTPVLFANVSDEHGVNTVGGGIGHDLFLQLNNDPNYSYVLNDYYESALGDFRSGSLVYELPTLTDGSYTMTFRAWDLLNNSSTKSISFKVQRGVKPSLFTLYAYPNPAESEVRFALTHDQPHSEMKIKLFVYSLTGEVLWNNTQVIYADENKSEIRWDLVTQAGRKLSRGLYLYSVFVESEEQSEFSVKSNKLLVK